MTDKLTELAQRLLHPRPAQPLPAADAGAGGAKSTHQRKQLMTADFRSLCAELYAIFEKYDDESNLAGIRDDLKSNGNDILDRARAALAQPEPQSPGDEDPAIDLSEVADLCAWLHANSSGIYRPAARAADLLKQLTQSRLETQEQDCEQHHEWELQDANDEWVAGGSSNDLEAVQAEGRRYLWQYAEDGMHKLIIRRHKTTTLMETESGNAQNPGVSQ